MENRHQKVTKMIKPVLIAITMLTAIPAHAQIVNPLYNACIGTIPNGSNENGHYIPPPSEGVAAWEAAHGGKDLAHACLSELAQDQRNAAQLAIHPNLNPQSFLFR